MKSTDILNQRELSGTLVLIRCNDLPELYNMIGVISSNLIDDNFIMVNLSGHVAVSFSVHELFVLRDSEKIERGALIDQTLLPYWDFNDIMEVAMLANSSNKENRTVGIELSRKNPNVFEYTMSSLAGELGLNRSYNISR